jgi:hypothetical protein
MDVVKEQHWWLRVEQDHARRHKKGLQPWWIAGRVKGPQRGSIRESHRSGYALFSLRTPRNQRVVARTSVSPQGNGGGWVAHGWYMQRQGAQQEGRGLGFDAQSDAVPVPHTLAAWQRAGDPRLFKIMLSPDHATEIDLHSFVRTVMGEVEKDLSRPLTWVAIDHHNTFPHLHAHICLRGVDRNGQELQIARDYLWRGLARRAGEVLTRELGWKLAPELEQAAQRAIDERRYRQHDRSLFRKLDHNQHVQRDSLTFWEKQRLVQLEKWGLAWKTDTGWQLAHQWKEKMMMENEREHQPKDQQQERREKRNDRQADRTQQERARDREREAAEERQRRIRVIDQLEQEQGWSR